MYAYNEFAMSENEASTIKPKKVSPFEKRIHELDFARGILIALVLMDHIFNLLSGFGQQWTGDTGIFAGGFFEWYWFGGQFGGYATPRTYVYPIALMGFCFVSGISCAFSKNNWKRAIETIAVWLIMALGSNILQILSIKFDWGLQIAIDFNIIGVLGISMLIYCLIQNRSNRIFIVMIVFALLMTFYFIPSLKWQLMYGKDYEIITSKMYPGYYMPVPGKYFVENRMGRDYFSPKEYFPLFWLPQKYPGYKSGDYMPLFPYFGFFFAGVLFSRYFYKEKKSLVKRHNFERPICFIGRHTLIIYLGHIPVLYGVFLLIDLIVKACIGG